MAYVFQVTQDASDPHTLADWWAETLGWDVERMDEEVIRGLVASGQASDDDTTTHRGSLVWKAGAAIRHPEGLDAAPRLLFQVVPEEKRTKNRMHLDVRVGDDDVETVVQRLIKRGATFLHNGRQGPFSWVTLQDPEGNEFCVTR